MAFVGGEGNIATLQQVQVGDVMVLKRGLYEIVAAGKVVARNGAFQDNGDKDWLHDFDGWELDAWCYVDWHVPQEVDGKGGVPTDGLTRATTLITAGVISESTKRELFWSFLSFWRLDGLNNGVETKDLASGLDYAPKQGQGYAADCPECRIVVVTNGYCYKSYLRNDDGTFTTDPDAYLNLLNPKKRYPLDPCKVGGAKRLLKRLFPNQH